MGHDPSTGRWNASGPSDQVECLIQLVQGTEQQLWWRQLTGSDATLDNAHVAEDWPVELDYTTLSRVPLSMSARWVSPGPHRRWVSPGPLPCTGSSQLVGLVLLFCTLNQLNKVWHVWPGWSNWPVELDLEELFFHLRAKATRSDTAWHVLLSSCLQCS
jgi:hypothetical protein